MRGVNYDTNGTIKVKSKVLGEDIEDEVLQANRENNEEYEFQVPFHFVSSLGKNNILCITQAKILSFGDPT